MVQFWLLFYDTNVSLTIKNKKWMLALNEMNIAANWFLDAKNQKFFGKNGAYLLLLAVLSALFESLILFLVFISFDAEKRMATVVTEAVFCFLKLIILIAINKKYKQYAIYDIFGIRKEFETLTKFCIFMLTCEITIALGVYCLETANFQMGNEIAFFLHVLFWYVLVLGGFVAIYLQGYRIKRLQRKNETSIKKNNNDNNKNNETCTTPTITKEDFLQDLKKCRHWSQITTTIYGFEIFMSHLQYEYSLEALLFLLEYVQIKHILMEKFDFLVAMIKKDRKMGFNLNLPQSDKLESLMAKTLANEINSKDLNDASLQIAIINAFRSLCDKYVNPNTAPFMINIGSKQREVLMHSLDSKYFDTDTLKKDGEKKVTINFNEANEQKIIKTETALRVKSRSQSEVEMEIEIITKNSTSNCKSLVEETKYISTDKNENLINYILIKLIVEMDTAAREISSLMQDSFTRFRKNANDYIHT